MLKFDNKLLDICEKSPLFFKSTGIPEGSLKFTCMKEHRNKDFSSRFIFLSCSKESY